MTNSLTNCMECVSLTQAGRLNFLDRLLHIPDTFSIPSPYSPILQNAKQSNQYGSLPHLQRFSGTSLHHGSTSYPPSRGRCQHRPRYCAEVLFVRLQSSHGIPKWKIRTRHRLPLRRSGLDATAEREVGFRRRHIQTGYTERRGIRRCGCAIPSSDFPPPKSVDDQL